MAVFGGDYRRGHTGRNNLTFPGQPGDNLHLQITVFSGGLVSGLSGARRQYFRRHTPRKEQDSPQALYVCSVWQVNKIQLTWASSVCPICFSSEPFVAARVPKMTIPNMSFKETLPVRVVFKIYQLAKKHSQCMHKNSTLQVFFGLFNRNTPYLPLFRAILIIIWMKTGMFFPGNTQKPEFCWM